jgi:plastocyanin
MGILVALAVPVCPALAANTNVTVGSNFFNAANVTITQGDTVTWTNTGGTHNVKFDDGSYTMPSPASSALWSVNRTFNTTGTFRYYCQVHGGPGGVGMSGTVTVNPPFTGYPRPKGASPLRVSLVPAYAGCSAPNRSHGAPLAFGSCAPPAQASPLLTVGTTDSNGANANAIASVRLDAVAGDPLTVPDEADVKVKVSSTDVRLAAGLGDYTGELEARLSLRITDRGSGPTGDEAATVQDFDLPFTVPCTATGDPATGASCSLDTSADAVTPGTVTETRRTIWELDAVQLLDGGPDGVASTTSGNSLFETQGVFVP